MHYTPTLLTVYFVAHSTGAQINSVLVLSNVYLEMKWKNCRGGQPYHIQERVTIWGDLCLLQRLT